MELIKVSMSLNRIYVLGHANSAPRGLDIVCAAVSALTLTLIQGLKSIALMELQENVEPGNVCIEWQTLNDTGKALIDTWFLGICRIAEEYQGIHFINGD
ncbi:ribosomal-processing cysteine protease Prp [Sporofaciens musculi]|uniref:ribosomal-processing cysteine protease Prp n=1 Tax=Sporofaciens musculi TaxID=2681861 RepID=UPI001FCA4CEE|nr:ribosomal-processing cysteine protease Prp [Sporofaciens musculi]